jgi:hypothetical protein
VDGVDVGVGREESLVGRAIGIGRVSESLLGMREEEAVRECRFVDESGVVVTLSAGSGGGGMTLLSRLLCLLVLLVRA